MQRDATALRELLPRLEAASRADHELFVQVWTVLVNKPLGDDSAVFGGETARFWRYLDVGAWLDACAALQDEALPGWQWQISDRDDAVVWHPDEGGAASCGYYATGNTPALAWLIAIVRVCIAEAEHETR